MPTQPPDENVIYVQERRDTRADNKSAFERHFTSIAVTGILVLITWTIYTVNESSKEVITLRTLFQSEFEHIGESIKDLKKEVESASKDQYTRRDANMHSDSDDRSISAIAIRLDRCEANQQEHKTLRAQFEQHLKEARDFRDAKP